MIDFSTTQLSWIVVGACSLGGTGYLTVNSAMSQIDKKVDVNATKVDAVNEKVVLIQKQLDRIEVKLDKK